MRRLAARYAKPGMVLSRSVYDSTGNPLFERGTELDKACITTLTVYGVNEIMVEDPRVQDVPASTMFSPEIEAEAMHALRELFDGSRDEGRIEASLLMTVERPIVSMARELFPEVMGEVNASGVLSVDDFQYAHPVKAAGLSMLIGRRLGMGLKQLVALGLTAVLADIGFMVLPPISRREKGEMTPEEDQVFKKHPNASGELVSQFGTLPREVIDGIHQHHERWDGSGFPNGLRGEQISLFARIVAVADRYYELVSKRPSRKAFMPHEAIEYIMAYSAELFDPELVLIFSRHVPLYPSGVSVKLNTGEVAIVAKPNIGQIGRPVLRMCSDEEGRSLREPFDLDLSDFENMGLIVTQVMDY